MLDSFFSLFGRKNTNLKPVVLVIFDGWGIAPPSEGNAISLAKTPKMDSFLSNYPHTQLIASGESVGLPANVVGNSEVGHLTIGVGRIVDESLMRINRSIQNGSFYDNTAFLQAANFVYKNKGTLHLVGMASSGNVHSSLEHLYALIDYCKRQKIAQVRLHLFTDGRDASPKDGLNIIKQVEDRIANMPNVKISTVSGRYYAMDRDARWDRTKEVYDAMTMGIGPMYLKASDAVKACYEKNITDEFVPPSIVAESKEQMSLVNEGDAIIFFNYRIDRPRQLSMSFVLPDFEHLRGYEWGFELDQGNVESKVAGGPTFTRQKVLKNIFFVTMTEYQKKLPASAIAFPNYVVTESLAEVLSQNGLKQFHLAESEKERMVTYYFDGLKTDNFPGEDVKIVASPKVKTYDLKPEMAVWALVREFKRALNKGKYNFIVMNIANPDMVAHTGNVKATVKAIEAVDSATGVIVEETLKSNGTVLITADHGNAEELLTYNQSGFFFTTKSGSMNTEHSNNPVLFVIMNNELFGKTNLNLPKGSLSDVAPTVLSLLGIKVPEKMTGKSIFSKQN